MKRQVEVSSDESEAEEMILPGEDEESLPPQESGSDESSFFEEEENFHSEESNEGPSQEEQPEDFDDAPEDHFRHDVHQYVKRQASTNEPSSQEDHATPKVVISKMGRYRHP